MAGSIAITVLNRGLRPFLSKWHPRLQAWEVKHPSDRSAKEHEQQWIEELELRDALGALRQDLEQYALALAETAGVGK